MHVVENATDAYLRIYGSLKKSPRKKGPCQETRSPTTDYDIFFTLPALFYAVYLGAFGA